MRRLLDGNASNLGRLQGPSRASFALLHQVIDDGLLRGRLCIPECATGDLDSGINLRDRHDQVIALGLNVDRIFLIHCRHTLHLLGQV